MKNDETDEDGKDGKIRSKGNDDDDSPSASLKRNSLIVDDFPYFDPDGLEVEDDWRDVFDDEDESGHLGLSSGAAVADDNDSKRSLDDSATDSINSSTLMPPPPPLKESASPGTTSTATTSIMPTTFSTVPGIEGLATNRPPLDHSITRRKKTAGTVDRRDSAPPSWHSEAADLPHRQAMVQDM